MIGHCVGHAIGRTIPAVIALDGFLLSRSSASASKLIDAILQFIHEALSEIESFTELSFIDGRASGIILADGAYDSGTLYDQVDDDGGQLITPLPANAGKGHRRQSAARLRAIDLWHPLGGYVYRKRVGIERTFAHQPAFGGGLAPLPPWVRTLPRVRRWIGTKLIIYHARMHVRKAVI